MRLQCHQGRFIAAAAWSQYVSVNQALRAGVVVIAPTFEASVSWALAEA
jgi:hypothetical protein